MPLFAVINTRGPAYKRGEPMEAQDAWRPHADFMNALVADGFVLLGGPLAEPDVLLIVRAESEDAIRAARVRPVARKRPAHHQEHLALDVAVGEFALARVGGAAAAFFPLSRLRERVAERTLVREAGERAFSNIQVPLSRVALGARHPLPATRGEGKESAGITSSKKSYPPH